MTTPAQAPKNHGYAFNYYSFFRGLTPFMVFPTVSRQLTFPKPLKKWPNVRIVRSGRRLRRPALLRTPFDSSGTPKAVSTTTLRLVVSSCSLVSSCTYSSILYKSALSGARSLAAKLNAFALADSPILSPTNSSVNDRQTCSVFLCGRFKVFICVTAL